MIDLHVHSTFSDGTLAPDALVEEACRIGLTALALTDHDTTAGVGRLLAAAEGKAVRAIPGVEISADFKGGTMHMLGYFVEHDGKGLNDHLKWLREGRDDRNREILHKLQKLGCHITWEEVASYAGEDVVGRPHFAQALQAHGYVSDKDEAFDKYLGKGKPGYAERRRLLPDASIQLIRDAKGVPVLAHPFTLNLAANELKKLVARLREQGLEGVEVLYPEHTPDMQSLYLKMARELNLVVTGGSDFHGALAPDIHMGRGFGNLKVPDDVVEKLQARRPA
jgi:3',5'-nucleoside bisphosphate phosphatase